MMDIIGLTLITFLSLVRYILIIDVILSWLPIFGLQIEIPFFRAILDPVYGYIRKFLPTSFAGLDFAPVLFLFSIYILEWLVMQFFPNISLFY